MGRWSTAEVAKWPGKALIGTIRFYQIVISSWRPPSCRYYPSCSNYAIEAIRKYGFVHGAFKGAWRLLRCNPFSRGGYDPA